MFSILKRSLFKFGLLMSWLSTRRMCIPTTQASYKRMADMQKKLTVIANNAENLTVWERDTLGETIGRLIFLQDESSFYMDAEGVITHGQKWRPY